MRLDREMAETLTEFFGLPAEGWPARALLQVDRSAGTVVIVQPQPCDCRPAPGATLFPAEAEDCNDRAAADDTVFRYDYLAQNPERFDALSPEEMNNVACFLLWQSDASPESAKTAHDLLERARGRTEEGSALRGIIDGNLDKFKPVGPDVPRTLAMLQEVVYSVGRVMASLDDWIIEKVERGDDE